MQNNEIRITEEELRWQVATACQCAPEEIEQITMAMLRDIEASGIDVYWACLPSLEE